MQDYIKFFEKSLKELASQKKVFDVGGGSPFQKHMAKYKSWFAECDYKTIDVDPKYKPDIVGDIHSLPIDNNSCDGILCMSVLEHVSHPQKAANEMHRILKKDGVFVGWVPTIYPYHARKGYYPDNFRFFDDGLKVLFENFSEVKLHKTGGYFETMIYFFPLPKFLRGFIRRICYRLDRILKTHKNSITRGFYIYAKK